VEWFLSLSGWQQALLATTLTWFTTALGASLVFFFKSINKYAYTFLTAFAGGIMLASSFFSLLIPAMEWVGNDGWYVLAIGFALGVLTIVAIELLTDKLKLFSGDKIGKRNLITCLAVTVHNVPEGLAVGVAFGALSSASSGAEALGAIMLAFGIAIQNLPEGACVAFPLRLNGVGRFKSFFIGQLSGAVEILAGIIGAIAVFFSSAILPFALSFSAGAMISVVCADLSPESFSQNKTLANVGLLFGFALMMALDIALG